jgi:6,7-dimethyl-8-ribityllumazine synthase
VKTTTGLLGRAARIAVVHTRVNRPLVDQLVAGALEALARGGVPEEAVELISVPGALELPLAARFVAEAERADGIVALAVVLRGETVHFDLVARESTAGLIRVSLEYGIPVGMGVLACDTLEQAMQRSGLKGGNKGAEAAFAALEMVNLRARLQGRGAEP